MRYRSFVADSARWDAFEFRPGDIVISTPPKCGTTWTQTMCALLVFDGPDMPGTIDQVSPWLDMQTRPADQVYATLAAQQHRRFIKTHTPLDGVPARDDVTYVVVGRDPRDVMVSMEHHMANLNLDRFVQLRADAVGLDDLAEVMPNGAPAPPSADPAQRFRRFIQHDDPNEMATLSSVLHHIDTAWQRRAQANVAMFHYADFRADLAGEMSRLAEALHIDLPAARIVQLAGEATLDRMRQRVDQLVPNAADGQWKNNADFLRAGATGEWHARADQDDREAYDQRVRSLVAPELAGWLHGGRVGSGIDPSTA